MKKAIIDIGSNSCRLAIAEFKNSDIINYTEELIYTRLADGFDCNGFLSRSAVDRTLLACKKYIAKLEKEDVTVIFMIGTAALRRAKNRKEVISYLSDQLYHEIKILSEEEEASYGFFGVIDQLEDDVDPIVLDIGGGSTEISWLEKGNHQYISLPYGALTLANDAELFKSFLKQIHSIDHEFNMNTTLIGTGGTITTLSFIASKLSSYNPDAINGKILPVELIMDMQREIFQTPLDERKNIKGLPVSRMDTILPGIQILLEIMAFLGKNYIRVSVYDGLRGYLKYHS